MKPKTQLDILYSTIAILDAIVTLAVFFSTCDYVINRLPDGFRGFILLIVYAFMCLGTCIIRSYYLLQQYMIKVADITTKNAHKKYKLHERFIILFPVFALLACFLSIFIIYLVT